MNFKKITSLVCVFMLFASCCAYGTAMRKDIKQAAGNTNRSRQNDIMFVDFSGTELPSGVTAGSGTGKIFLDNYTVLPKYKKNCLVINDTSYGATYEGLGAKVVTGTLNGLVGVEIRYMYDLEEETGCTYGSFIMGLYDSTGKMISRNVIASINGSTQFNYGGNGGKAMENSKIVANTWYTAKWVVDLDKKEMDFSLLNEGSGIQSMALNSGFYTEDAGNNLARVDLTSSMYGGKYVFDYVRISRESARMGAGADDDADDGRADIGKGTESEKIAAPASKPIDGRINISLDGTYKYTTEAPYEKDGKVMITIKNLAGFLNIGYVRLDGTCMLNTPRGIMIVKTDGSAALGDTAIMVTAEEKDGQIFAAAEDICSLIGYDYSYDSTNKCVSLTTRAEESAENAEGGETVEK